MATLVGAAQSSGAAKTAPSSISGRMAFIEVARVVCIFIVVLAHTVDGILAGAKPGPWTLVFSSFMRFAVPAFFMISGLLMGLRHRDPTYKLDVGGFWRTRVRTIVLPFFVWDIIYMFIFVNLWHSSYFSLSTLWFVLTGYNHLYFIAVLIQFLLVYSFMARSLTPRTARLATMVSAACTLAFYAVSEALFWTQKPDHFFFEWHWGKIGFAWALFFFFGLWLGVEGGLLERIRRLRYPLLAVSVVSLVAYWFEFRYEYLDLGAASRQYFLLPGLVFQFAGAVTFLAFFSTWERRFSAGSFWRRVLPWGSLMFGVYMAHLAVLQVTIPQGIKLLGSLPLILQTVIIGLVTYLATVAGVWICSLPWLLPLNFLLFGGRKGSRKSVAGKA